MASTKLQMASRFGNVLVEGVLGPLPYRDTSTKLTTESVMNINNIEQSGSIFVLISCNNDGLHMGPTLTIHERCNSQLWDGGL